MRDAIVTHVLGACAGYAYADADTVSTIMTRLGLEGHACVRVSQTVDAMFIFSTAYILQSRCGRIVILCYRGTETGNFANWLGDADIGTRASVLPLAGGEGVRVHSGFYRNMRATWWVILSELMQAIEGRSLADHDAKVEHPLEALYVTGHSLGGAMALLFSLSVCGQEDHKLIADQFQGAYTFGQPMALVGPQPPIVHEFGQRLVRHVLARDPVPALPPAAWGSFVHIGTEHRYTDGEWRKEPNPVEQLASVRDIPRAALAFFAPEKRRASFPYTLAEHAPHRYVEALRPSDRISEFGD